MDRKKLKKMAASLSALGAGALVSAGTAEADVVWSGVLNQTVGFSSNSGALFISAPMGPDALKFSFFRTGYTYNASSPIPYRNGIRSIVGGTCGCVPLFHFATSRSFLKLFQAGARWSTQSFGTYHSAMGGKRAFATVRFPRTGTQTGFSTRSYYKAAPSSYQNQYALFSFNAGPDTYYGWILLSLSVGNGPGSDPNLGPDLLIQSYAYGDANTVIGAGEAPEPATAASTGLAALALGAMGLRQWRKSRKAA